MTITREMEKLQNTDNEKKNKLGSKKVAQVEER